MVPQNIKFIIKNSIKNKKLSHCYLLKGYQNMDMDDILTFIINEVNKTNLENLDPINLPANVSIYQDDDDKKSLSKENLKKAFDESYLSSFVENQNKIIIFKNVENASPAALNSLLKTIEEPSDNVIFILTTNNINRILSTIKSRSVVINVYQDNSKKLEQSLVKNNYSQSEAWFYSHLFYDLKQANKYIKNYTYKLIKQLLLEFEKSFKNPYYLYTFFAHYLKKELKDDYILLLMSLKFIVSWKWIENKDIEKNYKTIASKIKKSKLNAEEVFLLIEELISKSNSNQNFFLQSEKTMSLIMEKYV